MNRRQFMAGTAAAGLFAGPLAAQAAGNGALNIVATTGMVGDLVSRIGAGHVTVTNLMGPGVDPHAYRQTRSDIVAMTRADGVFWHGLYLEAQMEGFFADLARRVPVSTVADTLPQARLLGHEDYAGRFDPHVWMDPILWSECAAPVVEALTELRPEAADDFAMNAETFSKDAAALHDYSREILEQVPDSQRVLITAHDAFGYFGAAYGYDVLGVQGISTESEAGLNRISELVDEIVARGVRAVFVETSVSERNVRALIEGASARGHAVTIGGALFSDAMGPADTYEGTWLGMIDHNVTTIAEALGAKVPDGGRLGRLSRIAS